jgi:cell volume regulation protein A
MRFEQILVVGAALLLLSIAASKVSGRLGIPALLLFLLVGILAGSDGPGNIYFDNYQMTQSVGVVALVFILFAGGLDTDWRTVRPVLGAGLILATLGVLLTALLVGAFTMLVLGFSFLEGVLLGAIVSSTDAAAVFAVLRSRGAGLQAPLGPLIELESGSNDPMAVFLTTGLVQLLVTPNASALDLIPRFVLQMAVGTIFGLGFGKAMTVIINQSHLEYDGLYPALSLALVALTYGVTALLWGNGFLAVYLAGLVLGNSNFVHRRSLMRFHDGIAWLMQITMFLTLGLLVFPSQVIPIMGVGLLISIFLILVARPFSVFVSLALTGLSWRAKALIGWVGLRGAVPIILATFPLLAGVPRAETFFNIVFFIVLTSVLIQGTSLPLVARRLGVAAETRLAEEYPSAFVLSVDLHSRVSEIRIPPTSPAVGKSMIDLGLPDGALVVRIERQDETMTPNGGTVLRAGDSLVLVATDAAAAQVRERIAGRRPTAAPRDQATGEHLGIPHDTALDEHAEAREGRAL